MITDIFTSYGWIIPLVGGIYSTLLGFRVFQIDRKNKEKSEDWYKKFGTMFKYLGPAIIFFGILKAFKIL